MKAFRISVPVVRWLLAIALGAVMSTPALAQGKFDDPFGGGGNTNPGILPPQSKPYGKTYGQWGADWWRWALSIPADSNPILDPTGASCGLGQSGPVWFLAGTGGAAVTRECSVPAGRALFSPQSTSSPTIRVRPSSVSSHRLDSRWETS